MHLTKYIDCVLSHRYTFYMGIVMRIILITAFVFSISSGLFAIDDESVDGPQKVIIYSFADISDQETKPAKTAKIKNEKFGYLSSIIPANIQRDMESTKKFAVEIRKEQPEWLNKETTADNVKEALEKIAKENSVQFVVAGTFSVTGGSLSVNVMAFSMRANKVIPISTSNEKIGVFFGAIIDKLSSQTASEMDKYTLKRTDPPSFSPAENSFQFYNAFSILPKHNDEEIWYTLNGSEPSKDNGKLYKEPFTLRRSADIKAVSYRDGFYVSKPAEKKTKITDPLSRLTIGITSGNIIFFGKMRKTTQTSPANYFSTFVQWEFANIYGLKDKPFIKNLGIIANFDSCSAKDSPSTGSGKGYITSGTGGLVYIFRLADFLTFDLSAVAGYSRVGYKNTDMGNGWKDLVNIPPKLDEKDQTPIYGSTARLNLIWGHVFLHADAGYRFLITPMEGNEKYKMNFLLLGLGLGARF